MLQSRTDHRIIVTDLYHTFFYFILLTLESTKKSRWSQLSITHHLLAHSSESRMSQIQICCQLQLCFCLDFKSNSSENCSCRSSTSGYTGNGHWAQNCCELQLTRRVRFHFNQKFTFKHAVMSLPSLKNIPTWLSKTWLKSERRKAFQQSRSGKQ